MKLPPKRFRSVIYVANPTGPDAFAQPTRAAPVRVLCRATRGGASRRRGLGESNAPEWVFLVPGFEVSLGAMVWPPGADPNDPDAGKKVTRVTSPDTSPKLYTVEV